MTKKAIIDKYDTLFSSGVEFLHRVHLCYRGEVEGASDEDIQAFCEKYNVNIPPALWSYTRAFGNKARTRNTDYNIVHSLADYENAIYQSRVREEWDENMKLKELLDSKNFKVNYDNDNPDDTDDLYTPEIKKLLNLDDIFVFHYDEFIRCFKFVDSSEENPNVFYFTGYNTLTSLFTSFTNRFRDLIFMYIVNAAPSQFAEVGMVNGKKTIISKPLAIDYSDGYECLRTYQEILSSKDLDRSALKKQRELFYSLNDRVEKEENRILSFTEFENKFIDYLKEKKYKC